MTAVLSVVLRKLIGPELDLSVADRVLWSIVAFAGFVAIGFSFIRGA